MLLIFRTVTEVNTPILINIRAVCLILAYNSRLNVCTIYMLLECNLLDNSLFNTYGVRDLNVFGGASTSIILFDDDFSELTRESLGTSY